MKIESLKKDEIAREILAYLADHPDATDTLEGIIQWWLLEKKISQRARLVKEALSNLVEKGLVEMSQDNEESYYRVARKKRLPGVPGV